MNKRVILVGCLSFLLGLFLYTFTRWTPAASQSSPANNPSTHLVSVASNGSQGNGHSSFGRISADGRFMAYRSHATNLVLSDTNTYGDVFVYDFIQGTTERVSISTTGLQADGDSLPDIDISAEGRFVAFSSYATNLVNGDSNGEPDIFVHDRIKNTTERVSVASDGTQGNKQSLLTAISADGRYVAFSSVASNLVMSDTNKVHDIFVHDRLTGITERVSVATDGSQANCHSWSPDISAGGRFVAFESCADNLVTGDSEGVQDIFVHDRIKNTTERVSIASDGTPANASSLDAAISANGRFVSFHSSASNLVTGDNCCISNVFLHDRNTSKTEIISVATDGTLVYSDSGRSDISADGRFVTFWSDASNLVKGDTNGADDIFLRDRVIGRTELISVATDGTLADDHSYRSAISADGRYVVFSSEATNLVPIDGNDEEDVFLRDRGPVLPIIDPSVYLPAILKQ